jgi:HSP20 family protein
MADIVRRGITETPMSQLFEDFLSEGFFNRWDRELTGTMWPRIDVVETPDSYMLMADLPGLERTDFSVGIENATLTISGEKRETKRDRKKGEYYHLERRFGSFCRSFSLPSHVDDKKVEAHFKNGVLELILKKTGKDTSKPVEVKID